MNDLYGLGRYLSGYSGVSGNCNDFIKNKFDMPQIGPDNSLWATSHTVFLEYRLRVGVYLRMAGKSIKTSVKLECRALSNNSDESCFVELGFDEIGKLLVFIEGGGDFTIESNGCFMNMCVVSNSLFFKFNRTSEVMLNVEALYKIQNAISEFCIVTSPNLPVEQSLRSLKLAAGLVCSNPNVSNKPVSSKNESNFSSKLNDFKRYIDGVCDIQTLEMALENVFGNDVRASDKTKNITWAIANQKLFLSEKDLKVVSVLQNLGSEEFLYYINDSYNTKGDSFIIDEIIKRVS